MNKSIKRVLSALPALMMMIVIFIFSSKPAEQSNAASDPLTMYIMNIYEYIAGKYPDAVREEKFSLFSTLVRKAAHMCEYALLAIFSAFHFFVSGYGIGKIFTASMLASVLYACTDEFHQLFIDGRAGMLTDVLIDSTGAFIGAIFFIAIVKLTDRKKDVLIQPRE